MLVFDLPNDTKLVKKGEVDTELVPMPMAKTHVSNFIGRSISKKHGSKCLGLGKVHKIKRGVSCNCKG